MLAELPQIETWLVEEWISRLAAAVESMAGERPAVNSNPLAVPPGTAQPAQLWRQPFPPLAGAVWVVVPPGTAESLGTHILRALGVEDSSDAEQKTTFQETLNQALSGLAQAITLRLRREVNPAGGAEARPVGFPPAAWTAIHLSAEGQPFTIQIGFEAALMEAIRSAEVQPAPVLEPPGTSGAPQRSPLDHSKTFELLLEVELPVTVSFGRAQIPLKDALKLTTGSVVELNRAVSEPVDIIVNNCVIARGEVVVVEGNFGVRVQEVINRQDRLRTVQ